MTGAEDVRVADHGGAKPTLDELALKHRTDKSSRSHNYAQFYDRIFTKLREEPISFLEVGVGTTATASASSMITMGKAYHPGASLRMWAEYFPNARIIAGIDTEEDCLFQEGNVRTALADSRSSESVANALIELGTARFDIILDDGLHDQVSQLQTIKAMFSALAPGGVYIIEDIFRPALLLSKLQEQFPHCRFHVETFAKLRPKKRLHDSNIIVILPEQIEQDQGRADVHPHHGVAGCRTSECRTDSACLALQPVVTQDGQEWIDEASVNLGRAVSVVKSALMLMGDSIKDLVANS